MEDFLREADIAGIWVINFLSFIVAMLLRRTRLLKAYYKNTDNKTPLAYISIAVSCIAVVFILVDRLLLQPVFHLYFLGTYTDWIVYIIITILLDLLLIGIWQGKEARSSLKDKLFFYATKIYRYLRTIYASITVLRFLFGMLISAVSFANFDGFVSGDYNRGNETETFEGVYVVLKNYGESYERQDLVIYQRAGRFFKKEIYRIENMGNNGGIHIAPLGHTVLSVDTVLFWDIRPNLFIRTNNGYLLKTQDERLEVYGYFRVNDKVVKDTTIKINLK